MFLLALKNQTVSSLSDKFFQGQKQTLMLKGKTVPRGYSLWFLIHGLWKSSSYDSHPQSMYASDNNKYS